MHTCYILFCMRRSKRQITKKRNIFPTSQVCSYLTVRIGCRRLVAQCMPTACYTAIVSTIRHVTWLRFFTSGLRLTCHTSMVDLHVGLSTVDLILKTNVGVAMFCF